MIAQLPYCSCCGTEDKDDHSQGCHNGPCSECGRGGTLDMPALSPSSEPAIAEGLRRLLTNFEDIAAMHPNDQPCYKSGIRQWGGGDLRSIISTLRHALVQSSTPPASKGVEAAERLAARMGAEFVPAPPASKGVEAKYCPGYCAHGEEHYGPCDAPIPSNDTLQGRGEVEQALLVFAACARDLGEDVPDDEWAKFRLLASDYRRAHAAFVRLTGEEPPYPEDAHAALQKDTRHDG